MSGVLICDECEMPFHGIGLRKKERFSLRMVHSWRRCDVRPQSVSAPNIEREFAERVLGFVNLDEGWRDAVIRAISNEGPEPDHKLEIKRIDAALANLRKQHLWSVISDQEFKSEYQALERQKRGLEPTRKIRSTPNLDRAAELLNNLPALWEHPGVTQNQRRDLAREVFDEIRIREGKLVAVKPRSEYAPLFAYNIWKDLQNIGDNRSS